MIVKIHCKWDDIFNGLVSKAGPKSLGQRPNIRMTNELQKNKNKAEP